MRLCVPVCVCVCLCVCVFCCSYFLQGGDKCDEEEMVICNCKSTYYALFLLLLVKFTCVHGVGLRNVKLPNECVACRTEFLLIRCVQTGAKKNTRNEERLVNSRRSSSRCRKL